MALKGILAKLIPGRKSQAEPDGDPRLLQAAAHADAAEAQILAQYPDGDVPPEAQAQLAKIAEMKKMTQAALAADEADDLQTLMAAAKAARAQSNKPRETQVAEDMTPEGQALFDAITWGDAVALRKALLNAGVNERYGAHDVTPLVRAMATPDVSLEVFLVLLEAGADVTAPTPWGGNALSAMASGDFGHWQSDATVALARALHDLGAEFTDVDQEGAMPLHAAIIRQNQPVAEAFIAVGADIAARMDDDLEDEALQGGSPLHMAIWQPQMVEFLIAQGADTGARNTAGQTPADYAADWLENGAEPEDIDGLSGSLALLEKARAA